MRSAITNKDYPSCWVAHHSHGNENGSVCTSVPHTCNLQFGVQPPQSIKPRRQHSWI